MKRGRALGKCNVKDVILVAKHESGPNIEKVNMFGSGGVVWGAATGPPVLVQGCIGLRSVLALAF